MGKKRKRTEEALDKLTKRLKKLEKRLQNEENQPPRSSRENKGRSLPYNEDGTSDSEIEIVEPEMATSHTPTMTEVAACSAHSQDAIDTSQLAEAAPICSDQPKPAEEECSVIDNIDYDDLLGVIPNNTQSYGPDIQIDLAVRLESIATQGLTKEANKELIQKYLVPNNAKLVDAPELNPETRAAISETILKRDKGLELRQKQLAAAIACISGAVTALLQKDDTNMTTVKTLMDASRILCNAQYNDSNTRRSFILYNLKKEMKEELQKTKIDTSLFGKNLAETLKAARTISKSGADLKSTSQPFSTSSFGKKPPPATTVKANLNWKPPPLNRRPRGNLRAREPVHNQRAQPAKSSHPYRAPPAPPRYRR